MWPKGEEATILTALLSQCIWLCPQWCCSTLWQIWWWAGARWRFGLPLVHRNCWARTGTGLPGRWFVSSAQGDSLGCDASVTWYYGGKGRCLVLMQTCKFFILLWAHFWCECSHLPIKSPGQVFGSISIGERWIFLLQECMFVSNGVSYRLFIVDVKLTPTNINV